MLTSETCERWISSAARFHNYTFKVNLFLEVNLKMKKILAILVAVAAIRGFGTVSGAATETVRAALPGGGGEENGYERVDYVGATVPPSRAIAHELIRGVRATFNVTANSCVDADDECNGRCHGFVVQTQAQSWRQIDFCPAGAEGATRTVMFDDTHYIEGNEDRPGLGWFAVSVGSYAEAITDVRIEVLGANNQVLALGATYTPGGTNTTPGNNNNSGGNNNNSGTGNPAVKTGVAGIAVIGAVAVLAAGSVVVSRRRSK